MCTDVSLDSPVHKVFAGRTQDLGSKDPEFLSEGERVASSLFPESCFLWVFWTFCVGKLC